MEFFIHIFIRSLLTVVGLLSLIIIVHNQISFSMWLADKSYEIYTECLVFITSITVSIALDASLIISLIHYIKGT